MAASYTATWRLIYQEIFNKLERTDDERYKFVPRGTVKRLFQRDGHHLLRQLFRCLAPASHSDQNGLAISENEFVDIVEARKLSTFWGALVFAWCGIEAARTALDRLVASDVWPIYEIEHTKLSLLPLSRQQLNELFDDQMEADKFFSKQACFCPVVLRNREEVIIKDASCHRLPYLEEKCIGEGSFGKVYRVKIAKNHFFDAYAEAAKAYNGEPQYVARKDYVMNDADHVKDEYNVMKKILSSNFQQYSHNIVQSLGCLQIGSDFSLFMPVAICDLRQYMMVENVKAPQELENKADIVRSAAGLASGLQFLHGGMKTDELEELVCYHMDLNPSNVLVFHEHGRNVWKLSDFGMSSVKIRPGQLGEKESNFNSLFVRRTKQKDPSVPATWNQRGEGTYIAPEGIPAVRTMKTGADIWALGCVLSVVFAYLGGGAKGVDDYADTRLSHRKSDNYDRFFIRGSHFKFSKVHPEIKLRHEKLTAEAMHRGIEEGKAVAHLLTYLQDHVFLIDQGKRDGAEAVKQRLEVTYRMLQEAAGRNRRPSVVEVVSQTFIQQHKDKFLPAKKKDPYQATLASQRLSSSHDFKGLVISPNANAIAFWTDKKVVLYTSESLTFSGGHAKTEPSEWELREAGCFFHSMFLTQKYLVASTIGQNFFYIFNLDGGRQVDLNLTSLHRVGLNLPDVSHIALSPDSKTLLFIMRNETEVRGKATLVFANLPEIITYITHELRHVDLAADRGDKLTSHSYLSENSDNSHDSVRLRKSHDILRYKIELDWPAADIVELTVSNEKDAYIVVRPELTAKTREHKIPIAHVAMDTSSIPYQFSLDTLNIVSLGFDGSTTAGFFTTFCVINDKNTCALVTRSKRFHLQRFDEEHTHADDQRDIPHYRIAKLFNCAPDSKLFAIGHISSKQQMMLMEVRFSPRLTVRELIKIPGLMLGDDVTAVAVDLKDKFCIILASLTGSSRRTIYRIKVPKCV